MQLLQNIIDKYVKKMGPFKLLLCILAAIGVIYLLLMPSFSEYQTMTNETMERMQITDSQAGEQ